MAVTISIQETIVTPSEHGLAVQLYISDAPRDAESAAMRLALTATIPHPGKKSLLWTQHEVMAAVRDALQETMRKVYAEMSA